MSRSNILILAIIIFAAGLRLFLVLTHDAFLGVDGGAYLLSRNAVLLDEPTGVGFPRPPLAPGYLIVPFTYFLGDDIGYKVWSALFSLTPLIPVYLIARDIGGRSAAIFALAFLAADWTQMEMMVTGALPQVGFGLIGLTVWGLFRLSQNWTWRVAAFVAGCLGLIPYVNHTSAGIAVVVLPVVFLFIAWHLRREPKRILWLGAPAVVGGLIGLGALKWYMTVLPISGELNYQGSWIFFVEPADFAVEQAIIGWSTALLIFIAKPEYRVRALAVMIGVLSTLLLFLSTDETIINVFYRSRYLLALPLMAGIAWLVMRNMPASVDFAHYKPFYALVACVWAGMVVGQIWIFDRQTTYSDMVLPQTVEVLEGVRGEKGGIITNSYTLSHWVAALNKVDSPNTFTWPPPPYYQESDENVRCLLGWVPGCDPVAAKAFVGADYILIDERFPYINGRVANVYGAPSKDPWDNLPDVSWLELADDHPPVKLWAINISAP